MESLAWIVFGSVAGAGGAAAAIVFGFIPLLQRRKEVPHIPARVRDEMLPSCADEELPVVVGTFPREPAAFQPHA